MLAQPPLGTRHDVFKDALMRAVVDGQLPSRTCDLGHDTRAIIQAIAEHHPEANPNLIADAFDAFEREPDEGEWRVSGASPNC
jgi:hypothetical protein